MIQKIFKSVMLFMLGALCFFSLSMGIIAIVCVLADKHHDHEAALKLQLGPSANSKPSIREAAYKW